MVYMWCVGCVCSVVSVIRWNGHVVGFGQRVGRCLWWVCVCVSSIGVDEVGLRCLFCDVVAGGGACVRRAACCGWSWESMVVCGWEC